MSKPTKKPMPAAIAQAIATAPPAAPPRPKHAGLLYLNVFVNDHLPSLPPSSRELTAQECMKALNLVQADLDALADQVAALTPPATA